MPKTSRRWSRIIRRALPQARRLVKKPFFTRKQRTRLQQPKDTPWDDRYRPTELVTNQDNIYTFDNFRWGISQEKTPKGNIYHGDYRTTLVNVNSLSKTYFGYEHFFPGGHAFLVFEFESPTAITSQDQALHSHRLVYTIEAGRKVGQVWDVTSGMQKKFTLVHQLVAFEEYIDKLTKYQKDRFELHPLNLTQEEQDNLLDYILNYSIGTQKPEYYHSLDNSCYSRLLVEMNRGLPKNKQIPRKALKIIPSPWTVATFGFATLLKQAKLLTQEKGELYLHHPGFAPKKSSVVPGVNRYRWISLFYKHPWLANLTPLVLGLLFGFLVLWFSQSPSLSILSTTIITGVLTMAAHYYQTGSNVILIAPETPAQDHHSDHRFLDDISD